MWNFRRGIDWATDPTGATIFPNTVLIDGLEGNDANDGLSIATPLKTLTQAKALYANTYTLVVAPWRYVDELGTVGGVGDTYKVIGDSEDEDVVFVDSLGVLTGLGTTFSENCVIVGYSFGSFNNQKTFINCTFVDCAGCRINYFYGCRFINTPSSRDANFNIGIASCSYINSPITNSATGASVSVLGSFFDAGSTLNLVDPSFTFNLRGSHFENKTTWDTINTDYDLSNTDGDPFIYNSDILNYSFDPLLSPLFGRGYPDGFSNPRHMAKYYIGNGFYAGLANFDAAIAANANLEVIANELLNTGPNEIETLETGEVVLNSLQAIGVPHKVGVMSYLSTLFGINQTANSLDRVLEIRYGFTDVDTLTPYKKYRFGEPATNDGAGLSNGEDLYSWESNTPVFVKRYQVRVGVIKGGVVS